MTITLRAFRSKVSFGVLESPETWSRIDELVASKWERMKIQPSDLCTDAESWRAVVDDLIAGYPGLSARTAARA